MRVCQRCRTRPADPDGDGLCWKCQHPDDRPTASSELIDPQPPTVKPTTTSVINAEYDWMPGWVFKGTVTRDGGEWLVFGPVEDEGTAEGERSHTSDNTNQAPKAQSSDDDAER